MPLDDKKSLAAFYIDNIMTRLLWNTQQNNGVIIWPKGIHVNAETLNKTILLNILIIGTRRVILAY